MQVSRIAAILAAASAAVVVLSPARAGSYLAPTAFAATSQMSVDEIRPGMVGVGRTVFDGTHVEEFRVHVLGVLNNVIGPNRDLILAKLEGGLPLIPALTPVLASGPPSSL